MKNFNDESSSQESGHLFTNSLYLSSLKGRRNCLTDLNFGSTLRVCSASSPGTPSMSEGFHAKMSRFSRMNTMSALSYLGSRLALILNCLDESPGTKSTNLVSSANLNINKGSCSVSLASSKVSYLSGKHYLSKTSTPLLHKQTQHKQHHPLHTPKLCSCYREFSAKVIVPLRPGILSYK